MNKEELEEKFSVYTDQISLMRGAGAYWALLHYIIIFPDICGALESTNGLANSSRYKKWASDYVASPFLLDDEWYEIRCKILHQGITLSSRRYVSYKFVSSPDLNGNIIHRCLFNDVLILDVRNMTDEILQGLDKWFEDIVNNINPTKTRNVENNINNLSSVQDLENALGGAITGLNMFISGSTSSNL
ncbi:MAG: hypothetical protein KAR54_00830 [Candidatus Pacebacteria bacterium]|nr:hypothetical protein [Candidatus Paceibacterota bacterium]